MGIIKSFSSAVSGAAKDQWKDAFICERLNSETLMCLGTRLSSEYGCNQGSSRVISEGSIITVGEGECALVTENGKIIGVFAEPGEQEFRSVQGSGVFTGGAKAFARDVGRRFAFGGDVAFTHRLYYVNMKEMMGSEFAANAVPVQFRDERAGVNLDARVGCSGVYSFRIVDPVRFYKSAIRSVGGTNRSVMAGQMESELLTALTPALATLTAKGIRPSELPDCAQELSDCLKQMLCDNWRTARGIEPVSIGISALHLIDDDMIRAEQRNAAFMNPTRAAGHLVGAVSDAMQTAAANAGGPGAVAVAAMTGAVQQDGGWRCSCGTENQGRFCVECGAAKPYSWRCSCGTENQGRFCVECGAVKSHSWRCGCGAENKGRFCVECGAAAPER